MNEVTCKKCNAEFDEKSLNSFNLCFSCDEIISEEINALSKIKRIIGVICGITFFMLVPTVVFPLLGGQNSSGQYVLKGSSRFSRDLTVSLTGILTGGTIIMIFALCLLAAYFYFKQKLLKKEAQSYPVENN